MGGAQAGGSGGKLIAVHRHLEDDGPIPETLVIAAICARFGCLPSEAEREARENPNLMSVMAAMAYRDAWEALAAWEALPSDSRGRPPRGGMIPKVRELQAADAQRAMDEKAEALAAEGRI